MGLLNNKRTFWFSLKLSCGLLAAVFTLAIAASDLLRVKTVYAGALELPAPNACLELSSNYEALQVYGIAFPSENPFEMDFLIDTGNSNLNQEQIKSETANLVEYFLAALAIDADDVWVNLSPYEADRIAPDALSSTALGRDLVAQDYILKQLTASLTNPLNEIGQEYWSGQSLAGSTALNKIWIVPEIANLVEKDNNVLINDSKLKLVNANDYAGIKEMNLESVDENLSYSAILPALTKELNQGKHFAKLRQIYQVLILATWFKKRLKSHIFNKQYSNQNKTDSIALEDKKVQEQIYQNYLKSSHNGVYKIIRKEKQNNKTIKKQYFSGGFISSALNQVIDTSSSSISRQAVGNELKAKVNFRPNGQLPYRFDNLDDALSDVLAWDVEAQEILQTISEVMGWVNFEFVDRKELENGSFEIVDEDRELETIAMVGFDNLGDDKNYETSQTVRLAKDISFAETIEFVKAFEETNDVERENSADDILGDLKNAAAYLQQYVLPRIPSEDKYAQLHFFVYQTIDKFKELAGVQKLEPLTDIGKKYAEQWLELDEEFLAQLAQNIDTMNRPTRLTKILERQQKKWIQNIHFEISRPYRDIISVLYKRSQDELSKLEDIEDGSKTLDQTVDDKYAHLGKLSYEELNTEFVKKGFEEQAKRFNAEVKKMSSEEQGEILRQIENLLIRKEDSKGIIANGFKGPYIAPKDYPEVEYYLDEIDNFHHFMLQKGERMAVHNLINNMSPYKHKIRIDFVNFCLSRKNKVSHPLILDYISSLESLIDGSKTSRELRSIFFVEFVENKVAKYFDHEHHSKGIGGGSVKNINEVNIKKIRDNKHMICVGHSITVARLLTNYGFNVAWLEVARNVHDKLEGHVAVYAEKDSLAWIVDPSQVDGAGLLRKQYLKQRGFDAINFGELLELDMQSEYARHKKARALNVKHGFLASTLNNVLIFATEQWSSKNVRLAFWTLALNVNNAILWLNLSNNINNQQKAERYNKIILGINPDLGWARVNRANKFFASNKIYRAMMDLKHAVDHDKSKFFSVRPVYNLLLEIGYSFSETEVDLFRKLILKEENTNQELREFFGIIDMDQIRELSDDYEKKHKNASSALGSLERDFVYGPGQYLSDVDESSVILQNGGVELSVDNELVVERASSVIDGLFANGEYDGLEINSLSYEIVSIDAK